jgi:hypothetical protein
LTRGTAPALRGGAWKTRGTAPALTPSGIAERVRGGAWTSLFALFALAMSGVALVGCGSRAERGAAPAPTPAPAHEPPKFEFVAPRAWQSKKQGSEPIAPPDLSLETWRVLVNQQQPIQIKTPHWQPLPAKETVELSMPDGSGFRCIVPPLVVTADANDFGTKLKAWLLTRSFICSGDGFRTWTEYEHRVRVLPDGSREEPVADTGALLRERGTDQVVRHTFVLLRTTPERREATTGPPKILPGVAVDPE